MQHVPYDVRHERGRARGARAVAQRLHHTRVCVDERARVRLKRLVGVPLPVRHLRVARAVAGEGLVVPQPPQDVREGVRGDGRAVLAVGPVPVEHADEHLLRGVALLVEQGLTREAILVDVRFFVGVAALLAHHRDRGIVEPQLDLHRAHRLAALRVHDHLGRDLRGGGARRPPSLAARHPERDAGDLWLLAASGGGQTKDAAERRRAGVRGRAPTAFDARRASGRTRPAACVETNASGPARLLARSTRAWKCFFGERGTRQKDGHFSVLDTLIESRIHVFGGLPRHTPGRSRKSSSRVEQGPRSTHERFSAWTNRRMLFKIRRRFFDRRKKKRNGPNSVSLHATRYVTRLRSCAR